MKIYPAIDLYDGKAVRLTKGDYAQIKVYSDKPSELAKQFYAQGARYLHIVDLQGARDGDTPNIGTVRDIISSCPIKAEIGGGIRSLEVMEKYLNIGARRVILGTAAIGNDELLTRAVERFSDAIVCGADIKDGFIAVKGWTELSSLDAYSFFDRMKSFGVKSVICTDVSKDGVLAGTNTELYKNLSVKYPDIKITASGGITSVDEIKILSSMNIYGAILGKAVYEGRLNVKDAVFAAGELQ